MRTWDREKWSSLLCWCLASLRLPVPYSLLPAWACGRPLLLLPDLGYPTGLDYLLGSPTTSARLSLPLWVPVLTSYVSIFIQQLTSYSNYKFRLQISMDRIWILALLLHSSGNMCNHWRSQPNLSSVKWNFFYLSILPQVAWRHTWENISKMICAQ